MKCRDPYLSSLRPKCKFKIYYPPDPGRNRPKTNTFLRKGSPDPPPGPPGGGGAKNKIKNRLKHSQEEGRVWEQQLPKKGGVSGADPPRTNRECLGWGGSPPPALHMAAVSLETKNVDLAALRAKMKIKTKLYPRIRAGTAPKH